MYIGRKVNHHDEGQIARLPEHLRQVAAYLIMEGDQMVHNIPPEHLRLYRMCGYEFVEVHAVPQEALSRDAILVTD